MNPEAIFVFVPGGSQSPAIAKALAGSRHRPAKDQGHGAGGADRRASA